MVWIALTVALVMDVLYVVLISGQPSQPPDKLTVPFVALYMAVMVGLLGLSLIKLPRVVALRPALRAGAAGGLLMFGALAIFSIGLPILAAGAVATGAALRTFGSSERTAVISEVAAVVIAVAVLVTGLEITERVVLCPLQGSESGSGAGLLTGPYHYECINGHLTYQSGS